MDILQISERNKVDSFDEVNIYMNQRDDSIDALKGFLIYLVVVGHICTNWYEMEKWIYAFHMPAFFVISGYIEGKRKSYQNIETKDFVYKKVKAILWPYYIWACITSCATAYTAILSKNWSLLVNTLISRFLGILMLENAIGPIWFLLVLFEAEIVVFLLSKLHKKIGILIIEITGIILYFILPNLNLPFLLQIAWVGIGFVYIGKLFAEHNFVEILIDFWGKIKNMYVRNVVFVLAGACTGILLMFGTFKNAMVDIYNNRMGTPFLFWPVAIGWSMWLLILFKMLGKRFEFRIIPKVGQESLIIMILHFYINEIFIYIFKTDMMITTNGGKLVWSLILTIICYYMACFIRRYMHYLICMPEFGKIEIS